MKSESDQEKDFNIKTIQKDVFEKLYKERTVSNFKKCQYIENERKYDRLDYVLSSTYNHCVELFPEPQDIILQRETQSEGVWGPFGFIFEKRKSITNTSGHPIIYGGVSERRSPHNVKLTNSSHHSLKTLPGYSRSFGGTVYNY